MARASSPSLIGVGGGRSVPTPKFADDLVVMLVAGSGKEPANSGQQRGYWHFFLLDHPPLGSNDRPLPFASRETENPASIAKILTGVFVLLPQPDSGGFRTCRCNRARSISFPPFRDFFTALSSTACAQPSRGGGVASANITEEIMKKTLAILATVAAVGVTAIAAPAPAEARGRGIGPGLAFGLAAGAITAGAVAASRPYGYGYGPGYGYYGRPAYGYGPGPYAYYGGGPYYRRHHYYRHW
ncbi:hypothetical protein ACVWWR_007123 [Bradyrhizobium sp. LM3.2]